MIELQNTKIVIRESLAHFCPIGVDWCNGLGKLGYYKTQLISQPGQLYTLSPEVDIFINLMDITDPDVDYYIKKLKKEKPESKVLSTLAHPLTKLEQYFGLVDYWFECGNAFPAYEEWFKVRGQKFISIAGATTPELFPHESILESDKVDFAFIGQFGGTGHGDRDQDKYLYPLIDNPELTSHLFGFGYKNNPVRRIHYNELYKVFNRTKVNINFHYPFQKNEHIVINKRAFDIAATGNFQLVDHPLYEELTGIKAYPDPKEFIDAFYYYKDKPEERAEITQKAKEVVLEKHTWEVRMKTLLDEVYYL